MAISEPDTLTGSCIISGRIVGHFRYLAATNFVSLTLCLLWPCLLYLFIIYNSLMFIITVQDAIYKYYLIKVRLNCKL